VAPRAESGDGGGDARAAGPARTARGAAAESTALAWLQKKGLKLVERNWRCKAGELDLVLRDGPSLVMVEVRLRSSNDFGGAAASIDARKRAKLVAAARLYLARLPDCPCRFDVVTMSDPAGRDLEWIRNAFDS
jgi:putative endonuclease